jgi:hypothetical protein
MKGVFALGDEGLGYLDILPRPKIVRRGMPAKDGVSLP